MIRPAIASALLASPAAFAAGDFVLPQSLVSPSPAAYDAFGSDLAAHAGSLLFVGVRGADGQGASAGAVEIFARSAGAWSFLERPVATGLAAGDQLGESVAGNATWLVAGASRHDASGADSGAAWVFRKGVTNWAHAQKLVPAANSGGARFGSSVALSTSALAIGAPAGANGGFVVTYRIVSNAWAAFTTLGNPSPAAGDRFGEAVALTDTWLAVGDPFDDTRGVDAGAVHLYTRTPLNWAFSTTIYPTQTDAGQHFGQSLSISGTRLAVGAYGADTGAYQSGRVDIFDLVATTWTKTGSAAPANPVSGGNFGWDVSLDGGTLAVGAPGAGLVAFSGEAELFARQPDASWLALAVGALAGAQSQDFFGASVATSAGQLLAAAPTAHPSDGYRGRIGAADLSADCDGNSIPDIFDLANGAPDCDNDGIQDACEPNDDGDALPDDCDGCPGDPSKTSPGVCGCGAADTDSDADGVADCVDECPNDPSKTVAGTCGCGVADTDTDSDGTPDCTDGCPTDSAKTAPGTCGCGVADTDTDSDGTPDCTDGCPTDSAKTAPGNCGCGVADSDTDSDGTPDCTDGCPTDSAKTAPGTCGCGVPETDTDSDGTPDCTDGCPNDPLKIAPGSCGCGVADADADGDGTPDCNDGCPSDPINQCDQIFEVPGEFASIQAAIDAVPSGQSAVVLVAAGVFNEGFTLRGKDVVVRGAPDHATILLGSGLTESIARFEGNEPATAGLDRLVFRQGTHGSRISAGAIFRVGGAVLGVSSNAFIRDCRFEQCQSDYGGAVYLLNSALAVESCTFQSNTATNEGGAMLAYQCSGTVRATGFHANRCGQAGPGSGSAFKSVGGRTPGAIVLLDGCSVTNGNAGVSGAAIEHFENANLALGQVPGVLQLRDCSIQNNTTLLGAAGLRVIGAMQSVVLMSGTLICANTPRNVSGPYLNDGTAGVCDCGADLNADGAVDGIDLAELLAEWGTTDPDGAGDVTHNGTVDANDLAEMLSAWGICAP